MVRHERGILKRPAVLQIGGNARRAKRKVSYLRCDLAGFRAPLNHHVSVCLGQGVAGELAGRAAASLEQQRLRIAREARAVDLFVQVGSARRG